MDEHVLIAEAQAGDLAALGRLLMAYRRDCYAFALRLSGSNAEDAEDAFQDAFLRASRTVGSYVPSAGSFRSWLCGLVLHVHVNRAKSDRARRRRERKRQVDSGQTAPAPASAPLDNEELRKCLDDSLGQLEEACRVPIVLHFERGFTYREVAAVMDVPEGTVATNIRRGLDELKGLMVKAGYGGAALGMVEAVLAQAPAVDVPAGLTAFVENLGAGMVKGTAAATAGAKAGVGLAAKVLLGAVLAGAVAGTAVVVPGLLNRHRSGAVPAAPPAASAVVPADGRPAPVNPYGGMQLREEKFEFARRPQVAVDGPRWVITFATTAACDATVSVVNRDGAIVRHLASGVLGANAPWPFRQNSLSQRIEWDGRDDRGEALTAEALQGCAVRVGLGLGAEFERDLAFDPYDFGVSSTAKEAAARYWVGRGAGEETYVLAWAGERFHGRVFTGDGRYVRTFWPPSAGDLGKLERFGFGSIRTLWGDSVPALRRRGGITPFAQMTGENGGENVVFALAGVDDFEEAPRPEWLPEPTQPQVFVDLFDQSRVRMAADRVRDEIYFCKQRSWGGGVGGLRRIDGRTGRLDETWFPNGELSKVTECCVGPDGNVYLSIGTLGYSEFIIRMDREGNVVPFGGDAVPLPKRGVWEGGGGQYGTMEGKRMYSGCPRMQALDGVDEVSALWTGRFFQGDQHDRGLYVSPKGYIVAGIQCPAAERAVRYGAPADRIVHDSRGNPDSIVYTSYVAVWDNDGKFLTANAVGDTDNGHGVAMDGDGNIYAAMGASLPAGADTLAGLAEPVPTGNRLWGGYGTLFKFRGGIPFPRSLSCGGKGAEPPAGAFAVEGGSMRALSGADGAILWAYPGLVCQATGFCTCHHLRYDMDYFARHWLPANHLGSVAVVDANGNIMARLGRYGNQSDADEACGRLHFVWPTALCVSDAALYVTDPMARRMLKAAIKYAAEETVPLP